MDSSQRLCCLGTEAPPKETLRQTLGGGGTLARLPGRTLYTPSGAVVGKMA